MESIPKNTFLVRPDDAVENLRKIHNLDKPGRLEEAINILQEWIQKQDHIVKKDFSRYYLETTLLSSKGSVEKSKKQIDNLCTMKTLLPKFFAKTNVKLELSEFCNLACIVPLPTVIQEYYRVFITRVHSTNFPLEKLIQCYQYVIILCEYIKANDYVNGMISVIDLSQINLFELLTKLNFVELQQFVTILIEGYGARLKGIYLITDSKAADILVKTLKQFLSEKISNRIHVVPTVEDLHKFLPKEIFPEEYGGKEKSVIKMFDEFVEELSSEEHVKFMKMMSKACSNESSRNATKFNDEYLGMPGSFRTLSVD